MEGMRPGFWTMYCDLESIVRKGSESTKTHSHEIFGVSSNRIELKTRRTNKVGKCIMSGKSNSMAISLESDSKGDERLHITYQNRLANDLALHTVELASTAHDLNYNSEAWARLLRNSR
jgi:hypothetical protein